jgi:CRISPR/Cas system-associated endonuclease Cas3-HD
MFLVKAGTAIQVQTPKSVTHHYWSGWMPYTTSEDKLYDKHEVWDAVAVYNGREDVPDWARRNVVEFNKVVIQRAGKYALVNPQDIEFLN